jgi:hypothetical protein
MVEGAEGEGTTAGAVLVTWREKIARDSQK